MKEPNHKYIAGLVIRAQHEDSDAFAELYGLTYSKVLHYAERYLRDSYLAQDAVQEIFILALKNISKLKEPTLFIAWMNQISFRVCYDLSSQHLENYGAIPDPELLEVICDDKTDKNPELLVSRKDEYDRLRNAIEELPSHEKQVIVLRYFNNMKIDDIVDTLQISKSTVKRYISSGLSTLKRNLSF